MHALQTCSMWASMAGFSALTCMTGGMPLYSPYRGFTSKPHKVHVCSMVCPCYAQYALVFVHTANHACSMLLSMGSVCALTCMTGRMPLYSSTSDLNLGTSLLGARPRSILATDLWNLHTHKHTHNRHTQKNRTYTHSHM